MMLKDGVAHAPRFHCERKPFEFKYGEPVEFKMYYFQAPRFRVANVLMEKDGSCG